MAARSGLPRLYSNPSLPGANRNYRQGADRRDARFCTALRPGRGLAQFHFAPGHGLAVWLNSVESVVCPLVPAKAGTQLIWKKNWIPARAGMSGGKIIPLWRARNGTERFYDMRRLARDAM
jgi:hypothetical protein